MQSWSVGILCFNEAGTIEEVALRVKGILTEMASEFEILLIDDNSIDGSQNIIAKLVAKDPNVFKSIFHSTNCGIGSGIRDIYFNSRFENVVFVPGDGQFDEKELLPYKEVGSSNFISFYRVENQSYSFFRNRLSWANKKFNEWFLGFKLRDVNWVKVYKRELLLKLELQSQSSIIESEICAKLAWLGVEPIEVRSVYQPRIYGESQGASFKIILKVYKELWDVYLLVRKYKLKHPHN